MAGGAIDKIRNDDRLRRRDQVVQDTAADVADEAGTARTQVQQLADALQAWIAAGGPAGGPPYTAFTAALKRISKGAA